MIDLDAYFERIGYRGERAATLPVLQALHAAHASTIPFENLTSLAGDPVHLDLDALQRKLVTERRGGYCYEHNSLFMAALQTLGFTVHGLAARVLWMMPADTPPPPRTHMLLQVTLEGEEWIADVGFGGLTLTTPLRFVSGLVQTTSHEPFRIRQLDHRHFCMEAQVNGVWQPLYQFDMQPQADVDYEVANWYVSSHPASKFVKHLIAARPDADGRHALFDNRYSRHRLDGPSEHRFISSAEELRELLRSTFAIDVPVHTRLDDKLSALAAQPAAPVA